MSNKVYQVIVSVAALALLITACSPPAPQSVIQTVEVMVEAPMAPAATEAVAALPPAAEAPAEEGVTAPGSADQLAVLPQSQRMIIKDAEMELLVDNTDRTLDQVTQLAADYGGYILSSQTWMENEYKFANLRMGVPSTNFETVLNGLRNMGIKVLRETASGQDVTAEYVDLESRLTNLEATADRVRDFLAAAKTVKESLEINQQLSELEAQIEEVKGQMRFYEGRAAYSTITVILTPQFPTPTPTLTPTPTVTPTPTPRWNPATTFKRSGNVFIELAKFAIDMLIWMLVVLGPFLVVAAVIFFVLRAIWLRTKKKGPPPPAAPPAQPGG